MLEEGGEIMLPDFHEFEEYVATHDVFTPPSAHIYSVNGLTPENAQAFFESVYSDLVKASMTTTRDLLRAYHAFLQSALKTSSDDPPQRG